MARPGIFLEKQNWGCENKIVGETVRP